MSKVTLVNQATAPEAPGQNRTSIYSTSQGVFAIQENGDIITLGTDPAFGTEVIVSIKSDLPAPSAGVITLVNGTAYKFVTAELDLTGDRLVAGTGDGVKLYGIDATLNTLTTDNTGALITAQCELVTEYITLENTNGSGRVFDWTGSIPANEGCLIRNTTVIQDNPSQFHGGLVLLVKEGRWQGAGLLINGAWAAFLWSFPVFQLLTDPTGTAIEVQAGVTMTFWDMNSCHFQGLIAGQTCMDIDIGVLPTFRGQVLDAYFTPAATALAPGGIDQTTVGWYFRNCPGIQDSAHVGDISFQGNTLTTTISTNGVYVDINTDAAWALAAASERFSLNADGQSIEYMGVEDIRCVIAYGGTLEATSGTNKAYSLELLRNGSVQEDVLTLDYRSTPVNGSHHVPLTVSQGDLFRLRVANTTAGGADTTDVDVLASDLLITKSG